MWTEENEEEKVTERGRRKEHTKLVEVTADVQGKGDSSTLGLNLPLSSPPRQQQAGDYEPICRKEVQIPKFTKI